MASNKKRIKQLHNWLDNELNHGKKLKNNKRKRINRKQYGEVSN